MSDLLLLLLPPTPPPLPPSLRVSCCTFRALTQLSQLAVSVQVKCLASWTGITSCIVCTGCLAVLPITNALLLAQPQLECLCLPMHTAKSVAARGHLYKVHGCVPRPLVQYGVTRGSDCRAEQLEVHHEEEDLASVLAEGIAKVLLHARHWSTSSGKGLQVNINRTSYLSCTVCNACGLQHPDGACFSEANIRPLNCACNVFRQGASAQLS